MPAARQPVPDLVWAQVRVLLRRQGGVVLRRQLLEVGLSPAQVTTLVRRGEWVSLHEGVMAPVWPEAPYLREVAGRLMAIERRGVISHSSAARVWGLPYVDEPPRPTLTVERGQRGEPGIYVASLDSSDVTHHHGLPITTPARTLVDVMREAADRGEAQALADGALRAPVDLGEVRAVLRRARGWPGVKQAREAWEHADRRAESALESRCRVWFRDGGLPEPELQVTISDGTRTVRVDFLFRAQRTVVEPDGRIKYDDPSALWKEKLREDWLRDQELEVVRATWGDGDDQGAGLVRRVLRAFERSARRAA